MYEKKIACKQVPGVEGTKQMHGVVVLHRAKVYSAHFEVVTCWCVTSCVCVCQCVLCV